MWPVVRHTLGRVFSRRPVDGLVIGRRRLPRHVRLARTLKDYWFLVAVLISGSVSLVYMLVFQVTPWDTYRDSKMRREHVAKHTTIGRRFLERGDFSLANVEFERALSLDPIDRSALNARFVTQLFLAMDRADWDAGAGLAVEGEVKAHVDQGPLRHVIEKYRGDLQARVGERAKARGHYKAALMIEPTYADALQAYGWQHYAPTPTPDVGEMKAAFRGMTEAHPYDYRGFHGLGYALYIYAIHERDAVKQLGLLTEAKRQSERALQLGINRLNVLVDLGEITRSVDPMLSINFHERSYMVLDDSETNRLPNNRGILVWTLLLHDAGKQIYLIDEADKRAMIGYQLALDYLALSRLRADPAPLPRHDALALMAQAHDAKGRARRIYNDQRAILDVLLPGK